MEIPEKWPTPDNSETRVRVCLIEVLRPEAARVGDPDLPPVLRIHMQEAYEVGLTPFRRIRPEFGTQMDLLAMATGADQEMAEAAIRVSSDLQTLSYKLYLLRAKEITDLIAARKAEAEETERQRLQDAIDFEEYKKAHPEEFPPEEPV